MEGILTCVIGMIAFIFLVNFPQDAHKTWRFLTERESNFVIRRIDSDRADAESEPFVWGQFLRIGLDIKVWAFALIQW